MAQIHKGSAVKGIVFIAGEALAIGGIVYAENMRVAEKSKFNNTSNANNKKIHLDNVQMFENIRNYCIGGAIIWYAINVVDGCAAKGVKHLHVGAADMKITPYVAPDMYAGIRLSLTF
jgi:hypothetical protein